MINTVRQFRTIADLDGTSQAALHNEQDVLVTSGEGRLFLVEALDGATWCALPQELTQAGTTDPARFAGHQTGEQ